MLTAVIAVLALWGAFVFVLDPDRIRRRNLPAHAGATNQKENEIESHNRSAAADHRIDARSR